MLAQLTLQMALGLSTQSFTVSQPSYNFKTDVGLGCKGRGCLYINRRVLYKMQTRAFQTSGGSICHHQSRLTKRQVLIQTQSLAEANAAKSLAELMPHWSIKTRGCHRQMSLKHHTKQHCLKHCSIGTPQTKHSLRYLNSNRGVFNLNITQIQKQLKIWICLM